MMKVKPSEKTDSLESFMRRQEKVIKQDEKYKRLIIVPVIVIIVSVSVLAYNLTAGKRIVTESLQSSAAVTKEITDVDDVPQKNKINLNTATADMLDSLPGIGQGKAGAIIDTRERMGGFRSVEDILNVDGIGEKILAEIRDLVYVETEQ